MCFRQGGIFLKTLDKINLIHKDERIRQNILPVKIIKTWGNVINAEGLLNESLPQITTNETNPTFLKNTENPSEEASILLDFGTEINGSLRILNSACVCDEKYATVNIKFGESANEACSTIDVKGSTNDHIARDFDAIIPTCSDQEFGETGFRFARITLKSPNAVLGLKSIYAVLICRDLEYLGSFKCNDELLNNIYDTAAYTCHLCMQRYLWDGIKRDRLVWVGDMHPEMMTIKTVFGYSDVMTQAIRFARLTTPISKWMNEFPPYSVWWLRILWDWYYFGGDKEFFEENREYAIALIKKIIAFVHEDGSDNFNECFLDWPTSESKAGFNGVKGLLALGIEDCVNLAKEYGETELSDECLRKLTQFRKRNIEFEGAKQTAALLSLSGIADEEKAADFILDGGADGMSTFMSYYILTAAAKKSVSGSLDMLRDYYGGMLKVGATTFWEDFDIKWLENARPIDELVDEGEYDIHGDRGNYCYKGFRHSFCHAWSSAPTAFLAETVLGIKIMDVGCKKIKISPDLGNLTWAKGTYPTPYGVVSVSHKKNSDGTITTEYTAPDKVIVELD